MGNGRRRRRSRVLGKRQQGGTPIAAPGQAPFSPLSLGSVALWLRADQGITIATGVSAWADLSGSGDANRNFVQATGAAQPTLNAADAGYNGNPTLSFASASSQFLLSGTWSVAPSALCTVVVVGNNDNAASLEVFTDGVPTTTLLLDNNTAATSVRIGETSTVSENSTNVSAASVIIGVYKPSDASGAIYVNARTAVTTGSVGTATAPTGMSVGANGSGLAGFLNGKVAEVIVYRRALSQTEVNMVLAYCGGRYGIVVGP